MKISIINASHFAVANLLDNSLIYSSDNTSSTWLNDFSQAVSNKTWQEKFSPFACVIFDASHQNVALVRDHLGMQPLYYYFQHGKLIFAETIPDILQHLPTKNNFNKNELHRLFTYQSLYTDETFHHDIYRVEPGSIVHINHNGQINKKAFWKLESKGQTLRYNRDEEYVEHFTELMHEAINCATKGQSSVAIEFSGGLDSSAIYCTAHRQGIELTPFLNQPLPGSPAAIYNAETEHAMLSHYNIQNLQRIGAQDFEPLEAFQQCAQWFAGPAPHVFYTLAHNTHQAVANSGHQILLSGFGGDQCVSAHLTPNLVVPGLIREKQYIKAWKYLNSGINKSFIFYMHPQLYALRLKINSVIHKEPFLTPYHTTYHQSLRAAECNLLQGDLSHEVRMRVEYNSVVSKKLGFEYRYPLLYPKLLEFFLQIPLEQKKHLQTSRYLIRRYMKQYLPVFDNYKKSEGLHILPGTMEKFKRNYEQGVYNDAFKNLPYKEHIEKNTGYNQLINLIHAYMLSQYKL